MGQQEDRFLVKEDWVDKNVIMKQRPSQTTNKNIELGEGSAVSNNKQ